MSLIIRPTSSRLVFKGKFDVIRDGFYVQTWVGWDDGVAMRRNKVPKAQAAGDFDVPAFGSSRTVVATGLCYAANFDALKFAGRQLTGYLAQGNSDTINVQDGTTLEWAVGRLDAQSTFRRISAGIPLAHWEMDLNFANPRRFGKTNISVPGGAVAVAFHYGNFPATSVLTVTGAATSYTIVGPAGKVYTSTTPVTAGHPHTIDMATGLLVRDGVYVAGGSYGGKWAVPPGIQVTQTVVPVGGTLTLSASTLDTSI